jgi:hypothetical protein
MNDLSKIPTHELRNDLAATKLDIIICQRAINLGILEYGNSQSVYHRLGVNKGIRSVIERELKRRKQKK